MKNLFSCLCFAVVFCVFLLPTFSYSASITLDNVTGSWGDGYIFPDCPNINFYLRYHNDLGFNIPGMTNGFKVYGPSSFVTPTVTVLDPDFSTSGFFDLLFEVSYFSNDGIGTDIVGIGGSQLAGGGLPAGYNDVPIMITTGGAAQGETLCIDSSWYPPTGSWLWAAGVNGNHFPTWNGPYCFTAEVCPCGWPEFTNCVDTLFLSSDNPASYNFTQAFEEFVFIVTEGPGSINPISGEWTYTPQPSDAGTYQTLDIMLDGLCMQDYCTVVLSFDNCNPVIDINGDCMSDVGDLVFLVDYMFGGGEPPADFELADADGSGILDIADLVYIVDYMFGGGPPPVK